MTAELAQSNAIVRGMAIGGAGSLVGRRLDRLRLASAGVAQAGLARPPLSVGVSSRRRAAELATALSGRLLERREGSVVSVESAVSLPLTVEALRRLPYGLDPNRPLVCLDVETTGLGTAAGTVPFLVGIGIWRDRSLRISQLVLPDHSQEEALLSAIVATIPADAWLISYNGRSFDWPLLVARFRLHRREPPPYAGHLDLLPVARQLWKHRLGSARLAAVESVAGVQRYDDLPGAFVPERYFRYLRDGHAGPLCAVVRHNRQDVISLGLLLRVLAEDLGQPERWQNAHPGDLGGLARAYARRGRHDAALECLDAALLRPASLAGPAPVVIRGRLLAERARLLARVGRHDEAATAWLELAAGGGLGAAAAWLCIARHREHRLGDADGALHAAQRAGAIAERARAWGRPMPGVERDLRRRLPRLRRRAISLGATGAPRAGPLA